MKRNVGRTEQIIRIVIGLIIFILGFYYRSWWGTIGFIPIITGLIGYCPINDMLGISTYHRNKFQ